MSTYTFVTPSTTAAHGVSARSQSVPPVGPADELPSSQHGAIMFPMLSEYDRGRSSTAAAQLHGGAFLHHGIRLRRHGPHLELVVQYKGAPSCVAARARSRPG